MDEQFAHFARDVERMVKPVSANEIVERGKQRRTVSMVVAAVIATALLIGGIASAFILKGGSSDDTLRPAVSGQESGADDGLQQVPPGFLQYSTAMGGMVHHDPKSGLLVQPCIPAITGSKDVDESGRLDSRRAYAPDETENGGYVQRLEQLAVYKDATVAEQHLATMKEKFAQCVGKAPEENQAREQWVIEDLPGVDGFGGVAKEIGVSGEGEPFNGGQAFVLVRAGNTLAMYAESRFVMDGFTLANSGALRDAKTMVEKLAANDVPMVDEQYAPADLNASLTVDRKPTVTWRDASNGQATFVVYQRDPEQADQGGQAGWTAVARLEPGQTSFTAPDAVYAPERVEGRVGEPGKSCLQILAIVEKDGQRVVAESKEACVEVK